MNPRSPSAKLSTAISALLEIAHVIWSEGYYRDQAFVIQTLRDLGVSEERILQSTSGELATAEG